jgi:hypothetical protein
VSGPGAGGRPTAAALLSDLLRTSPPPNDRGIGATQFSSVADPREHRWLIAARTDFTSLATVVTEVGLREERLIGGADDVALITAPASWNSVQPLIKALESANATPCIARYEAVEPTEVLQ